MASKMLPNHCAFFVIERLHRKGDKMSAITIKDIAKICGVGVSTVSRALNNHPDINPETKQRIMEIVEEYDFVPNNSARNLKITDSKTIAILVKGMTNPFFMRMIGAMEADIQEKKYSMELRHVDEKTDEVETAMELVKEKKLKGIIFLGGLSTHSTEKLEKVGVPYVLSTISANEDEEGYFSSISVDDVTESYKITDYLIKKGHKRIAIIGAPQVDTSIGQLRLQGYLSALKDNGIKPDYDLIWHTRNFDTYSMGSGYSIMKEKLSENHDFTAVYAISDTMAIGAIRALHEEGIRVPEDVSVAGFDGIDMGKYHVPSLTTIKQPFEDMAHKTTKILFDVINNGKSHRKIVMDATLVERESVRSI